MTSNEDFGFGFLFGIIVTAAVAALIWKICDGIENSGYSDKLVVEYHCPDKEYERKLARDMVNNSNVQTNFVNKDVTMGKHFIKYRLTNPK